MDEAHWRIHGDSIGTVRLPGAIPDLRQRNGVWAFFFRASQFFGADDAIGKRLKSRLPEGIWGNAAFQEFIPRRTRNGRRARS